MNDGSLHFLIGPLSFLVAGGLAVAFTLWLVGRDSRTR